MDVGIWMQVCFVVFLFIVIPRAALQSARLIRGGTTATGAPFEPPSRTVVLANTLVMLLIMFAMSAVTAWLMGIDLFVAPPQPMRSAVAGVIALAVMLLLRALVRALRTPEQLRSSATLRWMPRTPGEWMLYTPVAIAAGVAEEAAYRGVAMAILTPWIGVVGAALLCVAAFAAGHVVQERSSVVVIAVIALGMHVLVWWTGTLVVAMAVHAIYDLLAGWLNTRDLSPLEPAPASGELDPV